MILRYSYLLKNLITSEYSLTFLDTWQCSTIVYFRKTSLYNKCYDCAKSAFNSLLLKDNFGPVKKKLHNDHETVVSGLQMNEIRCQWFTACMTSAIFKVVRRGTWIRRLKWTKELVLHDDLTSKTRRICCNCVIKHFKCSIIHFIIEHFQLRYISSIS